jgi:hypothetical protein
MSALAKPMIQSTKVVSGGSDMVNIELCSSVTKMTIPVVAGKNTKAKYQLVFHTADDSNSPIYVTWDYLLEADRDADHVSLVALAANVLA